MKSSSRLIGIILIIAAVAAAVLGWLWLRANVAEGNQQASGSLLGAAFIGLVIVVPLIGLGLYFVHRGNAEAKAAEEIAAQRTILDMVKTQGKVSIADLSFATKLDRDQIEQRIRGLVGRGLFSGYVDWNAGMLYSVDAAKLKSATACPNCGGELTLAGKGLVKCPYCGAEIFL